MMMVSKLVPYLCLALPMGPEIVSGLKLDVHLGLQMVMLKAEKRAWMILKAPLSSRWLVPWLVKYLG